MFRVQPYLEKRKYIQFNLQDSIVLPGNGEFQEKNRYKFNVNDRDNFYDWYKASFLVDFKFEAKANGAIIDADTESVPMNGSFSLIKNLRINSGKELYKIIFIKNLLDFSDDYSRSLAKNYFWYLDNDATTATDANATNLGMRARALLSHGGQMVQTKIPLNRYSFFESLSDRLLPPMQLEFEIVLQDDREMIYQNDGTERRIVVHKLELWVPQLHFTGKGQTRINETFLKPTQWKYLKENMYSSGDKRDSNGTFTIGSRHRNPKHVFIFFQQSRKKNSYRQNPYIFDTFDLDGDDSARLSNCKLECGTTFYPDVDYKYNNKLRILDDLMEFRYRNDDYNSGVQLQVTNFEKLYPIIYFDLRDAKQTMTGDPQTLNFEYTLNEAANAYDYKIFAAVLTEEEFILKPLGNELVLVK